MTSGSRKGSSVLDPDRRHAQTASVLLSGVRWRPSTATKDVVLGGTASTKAFFDLEVRHRPSIISRSRPRLVPLFCQSLLRLSRSPQPSVGDGLHSHFGLVSVYLKLSERSQLVGSLFNHRSIRVTSPITLEPFQIDARSYTP